MIHTPLTINPTPPSIYSTASLLSLFTFQPIPSENMVYKTRPDYIYTWNSFTLSKTRPGLVIFTNLAENLTQYGYSIMYLNSRSGIKSFCYEFISLCATGVDCQEYSQNDIDFESAMVYTGGQPIENWNPHTTYDSIIFTSAFKKAFKTTPKYFIAGFYLNVGKLARGVGITLESFSNRSFTVKLHTAPDSALNTIYLYYFYSNWGIL